MVIENSCLTSATCGQDQVASSLSAGGGAAALTDQPFDQPADDADDSGAMRECVHRGLKGQRRVLSKACPLPDMAPIFVKAARDGRPSLVKPVQFYLALGFLGCMFSCSVRDCHLMVETLQCSRNTLGCTSAGVLCIQGSFACIQGSF